MPDRLPNGVATYATPAPDTDGALQRAAAAIAASRGGLQRAQEMHRWRLHEQTGKDVGQGWLSALKGAAAPLMEMISGSGSPAEHLLRYLQVPMPDKPKKPFDEQALDWATASSGLGGVIKFPKHFTPEMKKNVRLLMAAEQRKRGPVDKDDLLDRLGRATAWHGSKTYVEPGSTYAGRSTVMQNLGEPAGVSTSLYPEFYYGSQGFATVREKSSPAANRLHGLRQTTNDMQTWLHSLNEAEVSYNKAVAAGQKRTAAEISVDIKDPKSDMANWLRHRPPSDRTLAARMLATYNTKGYTAAYEMGNDLLVKIPPAIRKLSPSTLPVQRMFPLLGGPPKEKLIRGWKSPHTEADQELLREAYTYAAMHFPDEISQSLKPGRTRSSISHNIYQALSMLSSPERKEFNKHLTNYLLARGKTGIIYHPSRYGEHELRMFRPEDIVGLDVRDYMRDPGVVSMLHSRDVGEGFAFGPKTLAKARKQPPNVRTDIMKEWHGQPHAGTSLGAIYESIDLSQVPIKTDAELLHLDELLTKDPSKVTIDVPLLSHKPTYYAPKDTPFESTAPAALAPTSATDLYNTAAEAVQALPAGGKLPFHEVDELKSALFDMDDSTKLFLINKYTDNLGQDSIDLLSATGSSMYGNLHLSPQGILSMLPDGMYQIQTKPFFKVKAPYLPYYISLSKSSAAAPAAALPSTTMDAASAGPSPSLSVFDSPGLLTLDPNLQAYLPSDSVIWNPKLPPPMFEKLANQWQAVKDLPQGGYLSVGETVAMKKQLPENPDDFDFIVLTKKQFADYITVQAYDELFQTPTAHLGTYKPPKHAVTKSLPSGQYLLNTHGGEEYAIVGVVETKYQTLINKISKVLK